ncbi:hypothetical protein [Streptomyces subrutilus]|uniref:Lipoprotein n=1 Tax=Streptomyces subrutilus TaxID=36818 RepID=A0A1E5PZM3_9ACTN|nr:hypothetical protein [Streptomyces subrutilus]OEJ34926.1 hypothetical protein BGK67_29570 [Streptomyces subrutilus]
MPPSAERRRALTAAAAAAVLLASMTGLAGCGDKDAGTPAASLSGSPTAPASATATPDPSAPTSPSASASPSVPVSPSPSASPPPATTPATQPPAAPTRLRASVGTRGGGLALVRGGAAQEFTVTLRNGNSAEYRHLLVAFQMESLVGEPGDRPGSGPGFLLERFDPASGTWRPAALRVANDHLPASMATGGGPLAREAVRVERYRLRATAGGPTGSSPLMVSLIDTDADREAGARVVLAHITR